MQRRKSHKGKIIMAAILVAAIALGAGSGVLAAMLAKGGGGRGGTVVSSSGSLGGQSSLPPTSQSSLLPTDGSLDGITPRAYAALPLPEELRAMWVSFLEWERMDLSSETAARAEMVAIMENCVALGLNTVIAHVRPIGDAFYKSSLFPYSHLITGAQGQDPGYDPLAVMIEEAHARGLRLEAWVNPYRAKHGVIGPETLSANNPASLHPDWVHEVGGYLWYDPGLPEVQAMILQDAVEIVQNYDVDGLHIDDYFYPEFGGDTAADAAFDAATFAQYGGSMGLAEWRRGNVDRMVAQCYAAVKAANPTASFGVSVQGNNENNYNMMYADVRGWMAAEGFCDYVMPQLYWGFAYRDRNGKDTAAFANKLREWGSYIRLPSVYLYAGLAAHNIGSGDNGYGDQAEWSSGRNLADMVAALRESGSFTGFALFRYDFLYGPQPPEKAPDEVAALQEVLQGSADAG